MTAPLNGLALTLSFTDLLDAASHGTTTRFVQNRIYEWQTEVAKTYPILMRSFRTPTNADYEEYVAALDYYRNVTKVTDDSASPASSIFSDSRNHNESE